MTPKNVAATDQWKALIADVLPPGELQDLLSKMEVVPDNVATPEDFIICGDTPIVPSEPVECSQCSTPLFRSLQAPKPPKVICIACVGLIK